MLQNRDLKGVPRRERICVTELKGGVPQAVITCNEDRTRYFLRKVDSAGLCGEVIKSAKTPFALTTFSRKGEEI